MAVGADLIGRFRSGWNAFRNYEKARAPDYGAGYGTRPDRVRYRHGNERSIIASVITRIAIDAASIDIRHVRTDDKGRFIEDMNSGLNNCLTLEANIDQAARDFRQDIFQSLCDEGVVAVVPIDTDLDPETGSYEIYTMRVGKIVEWFPAHVRVDLYNDRVGRREQIIVPKRTCAIITNPLYAVMNEPNSTLRRLIHKLNLLDAIDDQSGSGKMDLILQMPYALKTEMQITKTKERVKDIERQLSGSKYGIAYIDGTEKVIQLNRSLENNLMGQIEFLTSMLYSQLGMTESIFDGTADEAVLLNYHNRTIEPLVSAVTEVFNVRFLTKTARTQKQRIVSYRNPFRLAQINSIADIADKFTRNEILSPNEVRQIIGMKPSDDPSADELQNRNMPAEKDEAVLEKQKLPEKGIKVQNEMK